MAKDELIDDHVSLQQCEKAINALHSHQSKKQAEQEKNELLPGKEENIWLNVSVKKVSPTLKLKPVRIPIVHPIVDPRTTPVCLITKDPQREYKDLLETHKIKFISRVVGLTKLKGKFRPFDARRALLKENGLFLADDRIIPTLPKLLGSKWFEAKKQPIPVKLTKKDLKKELERAISSTYMNQNRGTHTTIRIGVLSQKPSQILDNLKIALPAIVQHVKDGWDNIQSLYVKTNSSVSLPIWTCRLDDSKGGRWDGLTAEMEDNKGGSTDEEAESDNIPTSEVLQQENDSAKGKKRVPEDHEDGPKRKKSKKAGDVGSKQKSKGPSEPIRQSKKPIIVGIQKQGEVLKQKKQKTEHKSDTTTSDETVLDKKSIPLTAKKVKETYTFGGTPSTLSITQADLKQKRLKDASEKKKKKILGSKGGKSVKASVLGRKTARG
ncbi:hypothetical protein AX15_002625 [Amanita polypyramis BW_CC]|nr:hypothetical protein AX15_002625 [Amanita polypyramis BW_CC]